MKKLNILLLLLAIFVALTVLISCGGSQNENSGNANTDNNISTDTNDNIDTDSDKTDDSNDSDDEIQENYTDGLEFFPLDDGTLAVECNSDIIKYLTKIVIPAKHNGKIVSKIGKNAFEDFTNIRTIVIPDSITEICYSAFSGCSNLSNIVIGNSVTSIGEYAFSGCKSLTSIVIPNSVTSIGESAFKSCSSLESITLPFVGNGSDKTHFGYIFGASFYSENSKYVPTSLKSVTITGTSIGDYAFYYCSNLTSIVIPNSVTSIGYYAFSGCSKLTIYCEAESKPSGWDLLWNNSSRPVEWGYKE